MCVCVCVCDRLGVSVGDVGDSVCVCVCENGLNLLFISHLREMAFSEHLFFF